MPTITECYEIVAQMKGSIGGQKVYVGQIGPCRFCGNSNRKKFRKVAHAFPEALGNKWVISLDECDDCNKTFSAYEDALAKSIGSILTLGGVKGKGNHVRQTGRSSGPYIRQTHGEKRRLEISARSGRPEDYMTVDSASGNMQLRYPVPNEKFVPRLAYKALCKMAFSMLPSEELQHFQKMRDWLLVPRDNLEFPILTVGLSFASVGNSPPLAVGTLTKRRSSQQDVPYMLFFFSAGSICMQIDLMPDELDNELPPGTGREINVCWSNVVSDGNGGPPIKFQYGKPTHLNWADTGLSSQPIEAVILDFDPSTQSGNLTPRLRSM